MKLKKLPLNISRISLILGLSSGFIWIKPQIATAQADLGGDIVIDSNAIEDTVAGEGICGHVGFETSGGGRRATRDLSSLSRPSLRS